MHYGGAVPCVMIRGVLIGTALGALTAASRLDAQEVWLVPDGFKLASTSSILATARAGSPFPSGKSPMRPTAIVGAASRDREVPTIRGAGEPRWRVLHHDCHHGRAAASVGRAAPVAGTAMDIGFLAR